MIIKNCRFCDSPLKYTFVDLGVSPLANSYIHPDNSQKMEAFYPLHVYVCESCFLVQLDDFISPESIFREYSYFSGFSDTWLKHTKNYTDQIIERFHFNSSNLIIELASNDGSLLKNFKEKDIPVLGIEPAENVAKLAETRGIQTITKFFGVKTATELVIEKIHADLLLGNNVLAHVPDINDFVKGMKIILKPKGIITMEFPHLMQLMDNNQFDTIYHEHFSYLSLLTVEKIFAKHALTIFDVEELFTHGGSLRIFATHKENNSFKISPVVETMKTKEIQFGLNKINSYVNFSEKVKEAKRKILKFLISLKQDGMSIVAYGAPAKANTLLNYCGIGIDFIDYTVDISPYKQGLLLPGTRIPIFEPERIKKTKPNYILILPWNIKDEIIDQMSYIRDWGGKFIILIPEIEVLDCEIY